MKERMIAHSMKISVFNDVWYDCLTAVLNDVIYSIDNNRVDLIFDNTYKYVVTEEKMNSGKVYHSFQTASTNTDSLSKAYFYNEVTKQFTNKKKLIKGIIELLKEGRIVIADVDMFYYMPEITGIYHINHIPHASFIHDYDKEKHEFLIFEGIEHRIPEEELAEACINLNGSTWSAMINESVNLPSVTLEDIKEQSKQIVDSVEQTIFNRDDLWVIDSPTPEDIDFFLSIATTHLNNIKNRNHANAWLYRNIINPNCSDNPFQKIEKEIEVLRKLIMVYCKKYKWETIAEIKKKVLVLIKQECDIWKTL